VEELATNAEGDQDGIDESWELVALGVVEVCEL
jgi:hypothetical protein